MVPGAKYSRVGCLFPCLHHIRVGSQTIGVQVPHTVVVALHTSTLKAIDAGIECGVVGHTTINVVSRVVVDLSFYITYNRMHTPDVVVLTTLTISKETRSIGLIDTAQSDSELCGMISEQQVATIGSKSLQSFNSGIRGKIARQVLPAFLNTDAVAHHPTGHLLLNVELVNGSGGNENALACIHIVLLEPSDSIFLVGTLLIVVWHKHCNHVGSLLLLICYIEANSLAFRENITETSLHSVEHILVDRCLLDEIATEHLVEVHDVLPVFDDADASLSWSSGISPSQSDLATTVLIFGFQIADSAYRLRRRGFKFNV